LHPATRIGDGWLTACAADFLTLPTSVIGRLATALRAITPRHRRRRNLEPKSYGAGRSLREGVSRDLTSKHWYESGDAAATAAAISSRVFREIAPYLKKRGYDVSQLQDDRQRVVQTNTAGRAADPG
jgi:hypothetical protein